MATSSYYATMRDGKKKEAGEYKKYAEKIERILGRLRTKLTDEQESVNRYIAKLEDHLEAGIKQVPTYESNCFIISQHREKSVSADAFLSVAEEELDTESRKLRKKQQDAIDEAERYERLRIEAKAREDEERRKRIERIMKAVSDK